MSLYLFVAVLPTPSPVSPSVPPDDDDAIHTQLIIGIIVLHNWWTDIKRHASNAVNGVGDVFDRRALAATPTLDLLAEQEEEEEGEDARQAEGMIV